MLLSARALPACLRACAHSLLHRLELCISLVNRSTDAARQNRNTSRNVLGIVFFLILVLAWFQRSGHSPMQFDDYM